MIAVDPHDQLSNRLVITRRSEMLLAIIVGALSSQTLPHPRPTSWFGGEVHADCEATQGP